MYTNNLLCTFEVPYSTEIRKNNTDTKTVIKFTKYFMQRLCYARARLCLMHKLQVYNDSSTPFLSLITIILSV